MKALNQQQNAANRLRSGSAGAKCVLARELHNAASKAGASTTAHAVLALLIIDSWWDEAANAWIAKTPQSALATRLDVHRDTIARAVRELAALVESQSGRGSRCSRYLLRSPTRVQSSDSPSRCNAADHEAQGRNPDPYPPVGVAASVRGETLHPAVESACLGPAGSPHSYGDQCCTGAAYSMTHGFSNSNSMTESDVDRAFDGGGAAESGASEIQTLMQQRLVARPPWLAAGLSWIDAGTARQLVRLPLTSLELIETVLDHCRRKRKTDRNPRGLENPAGWLVKQLRAPCDELRQEAERRLPNFKAEASLPETTSREFAPVPQSETKRVDLRKMVNEARARQMGPPTEQKSLNNGVAATLAQSQASN